MRYLTFLTLSLMFSHMAYAELLPANKAFQFSVQSDVPQQATLTWNIQPDYYLYQQKISVQQNNKAIKLKLPKGVSQYDENFGHSQVYWNKLSFNIKVDKNQTYTVMWQGCAKDQICYAPQRMQFQTDATGAVISPQSGFSLKTTKSNSVFMQSKTTESNTPTTGLGEQTKTMLVDEKPNDKNQDKANAKTDDKSNTKLDDKKSSTTSQKVDEKQSASKTADEKKNDKNSLKNNEQTTEIQTTIESNQNQSKLKLDDKKLADDTQNPSSANDQSNDDIHNENILNQSDDTALSSSNLMPNNQTSTSKPSQIVAEDQHWLQQLQQHSFGYAVLLFLGLGFLLAFTPCSLPMIPILSSLLVREHKGVKAWTIALVFVLSMASVYAVMGFIASSAGLGLQRWLQQPATVIGFAILFVIFAINLFGAFEIKLPNRIVQRLDHWQSLQQGGTLVSAGIMGMLSALLVGPCMTAPLAGVLLFISQSEHQWQGAMLLFSMGFGMGIPLLLVSILGEKALPKAGMWMNQVKVFFGFVMLALALYFIRPLIPTVMYQMLMTILALSAVAYILYKFMWKSLVLKTIYALSVVASLMAIGYYHYQQHQPQNQIAVQQLQWHKVTQAQQLQQTLATAQGQKVLIDVYADWCVSCQPIERMFKQADVQNALQGYYLIKLDLSEYDPEHQALLDSLEVLGPPTVMFLDEQGQELRQLRLTGSFKQAEFMQRVNDF
ncbi:protein-disulfide reductase DsbD [Moraxella sp. ZY210820]|uniref:protein-disulfide reductase DsbD n=1 Tax=unclassified Moraxella TaxID=2685852 RepID=UPI002730AC7F|nr:protein-disulfide reductase DsbD [Moraxella sp. ZY210820]WLF83853.1 protein-disulfide reductase DsbD [Moraxella sp. ZY210820]